MRSAISQLEKGKLTTEEALFELARIIRLIAERDESVGRGVLLTALPKGMLDGSALGITAYLPSNSSIMAHKAAHLVCGNAIIKGVTFESIGQRE